MGLRTLTHRDTSCRHSHRVSKCGTARLAGSPGPLTSRMAEALHETAREPQGRFWDPGDGGDHQPPSLPFSRTLTPGRPPFTHFPGLCRDAGSVVLGAEDRHRRPQSRILGCAANCRGVSSVCQRDGVFWWPRGRSQTPYTREGSGPWQQVSSGQGAGAQCVLAGAPHSFAVRSD